MNDTVEQKKKSKMELIELVYQYLKEQNIEAFVGVAKVVGTGVEASTLFVETNKGLESIFVICNNELDMKIDYKKMGKLQSLINDNNQLYLGKRSIK